MVISVTLILYSSAMVCAFFWPTICWLPRLGGCLVGISVFLQGYLSVNDDKFSDPWQFGLTKAQFYLHFSNIAAVIGTIYWTFGDLFPQILWQANTACSG
jgi:hypothetical protein